MEEHRIKVERKFNQAFQENSNMISFEPQVNNLEKSIFNEAVRYIKRRETDDTMQVTEGEFIRIYRKVFMKVYFNLFRNPCATYVQSRVLNGDWDITDIAHKSHNELDPYRAIQSNEQFDRYVFIHNDSDQMKRIKAENKGVFKCGRCKSDQTSYTQAQTRSADEPMTTFVTCEKCGNRWKM
jgi:DNA-directed RNA polymerase subunit M/transcription elongation factor TFIIS